MASVNKVILIGNLGRDPEMRHSSSGSPVCNFTIATSRTWKDKASGEKQEETEWHRIVAFDKLAEVVGEYLKKGKAVYVEGRLKTRKWQDKDGNDKYTTEVMAEFLQLLGGREDGGGDRDEGGAQEPMQTRKPPAKRVPVKSSIPKPSTEADDMDDDIPF